MSILNRLFGKSRPKLLKKYTPLYLAAANKLWEAKGPEEKKEAQLSLKRLYSEMQSKISERPYLGTQIVNNCGIISKPHPDVFQLFLTKLSGTEASARGIPIFPEMMFKEYLYIFNGDL